MRQSVDAKSVNEPKLLAGMPWQLPVGVNGLMVYTAVITHNWYYLVLAVIATVFLSGASKSDSLFLKVYVKHTKFSDFYSPAPISSPAQRSRRPIGFGRYDPN
jgi:type IV secretory pathway TrbD component